VRQRNPGPYVYDLPTLGVRLLSGEEIDHPDPLAGLVPVTEGKSKSATRSDESVDRVKKLTNGTDNDKAAGGVLS
jgi:hypothetical protein